MISDRPCPGIQGASSGRIDLLAEVVTEKYRRAVISYMQNFFGMTSLQFLPVR